MAAYNMQTMVITVLEISRVLHGLPTDTSTNSLCV